MTSLPQPIFGHALQDPSTDSRKAEKWKPGNTGTRTRNTGRQRSGPGEGKHPGHGDGEIKKPLAGMFRGGRTKAEMGGSQVGRSGLIPGEALWKPVSGGPSKAEYSRHFRPAQQRGYADRSAG